MTDETNTETDKQIEQMIGSPSATQEPTTEVKETTGAAASENAAEETKSAQTDDGGTDWKAEARKWETRAKENVPTTKHEEVVARVSELETALNDAAAKVMRWQVAAKHGLSAEDVDLFLTATDEETLEKQAQRLSQSSAHSAPKPDAAQGTRTSTGPLTAKQQGAAAVESLFN